jgi:lipopolysaccharide transport system ATP-binding protein
MMDEKNAVVVERLSKSFRVVPFPKRTTLKEAVVSLKLFGSRKKAQPITALNNVTFNVRRGSTFGIVGRNGSGKTTLMRLIAGIYVPSAGSVSVQGDVAPLLSLGVGFHPDMTGRENVILSGLVLGLSRKQILDKLDEIIDFSEIPDFVDLPVRTYSTGMYTRLAFAVAVSVNPDVLLLDEVLSVGDEAFAAKCHERIRSFKEQGKTILLVTHDPTTLLNWCDTAVWLDRGVLRMHSTANAVVDAYHAELKRPGSPS